MLRAEDVLPEVNLQPGELFLAHEPTLIRTILGSCVGVTFWNARLTVGALCHAMLPRIPPSTHRSGGNLAGHKYVDFCILDLARQFDELGIARHEIEVKLFGGADIFIVPKSQLRPTVGKLNCDTALELLQMEGYTVVASSLGDVFGRKICFNTGNGEVTQLRLT